MVPKLPELPRNGNGKLDTSGPSWTGLIAVLAIGIGIWQIIDPRVNVAELKTEIRASIGRIEDRIERNHEESLKGREALRKDTVTQAEHLEFKAREDARLGAIESFVTRLQEGQVTRAEHNQHWHDIEERINGVRNEVQEIRNKFDATYNSGDALKSLQKQIDDLRGVHVSTTFPTPQGAPTAANR